MEFTPICRIAGKLYARRLGRDPELWPNHHVMLETLRQADDNTLFVFQHGDPPLELLAVSREKPLKSVAMAHGVILFHEAVGGGELLFNENHPYNFYREMIMPNPFYGAKYATEGVAREKMRFLGCPRFFPEWMAVIRRIYPAPAAWQPKGLKVLFLLEKGEVATGSGTVEVISMAGQAEALRFLDATPGIDMAIKVNTRGVAGRQWKVIKKLANSRIIAEKYATPELVAWADVVVASCSSAVMDPIVRGTTMVMIPYIHPGRLLYQEYNTACVANSFEEFQQIMRALVNDPRHRTYTDEESRPFVKEIVFAGDDRPGALERYARHLIQLATTAP